MRALISPAEGNRICDVQEKAFEVAAPLYWIDCPDDCRPDSYRYDGQRFTPIIAAAPATAPAPLPTFNTADRLAAYLRTKSVI
ncbi:MAG TPA: hypothetical protein VEQ87_16785 [Burkholderiales bacterium]|nr:hypothetical protein [Burkholderiales bacterium]